MESQEWHLLFRIYEKKTKISIYGNQYLVLGINFIYRQILTGGHLY